MLKKVMLLGAALAALACGTTLFLNSADSATVELAERDALAMEIAMARKDFRLKTIKEQFKEQRRATAVGTPQSDEGGPGTYAEWFRQQRVYPGDSYPPGAIRKALQHVAANNVRSTTDTSAKRTSAGIPLRGVGTTLKWGFLGPSTIPDGQTDTGAGVALSPVSGRVPTLATHPSDPNIVLAGGAYGGVWKTTNATDATPIWVPLTDQEASLAMGAIAIDPVDPDIIYAGTGEPTGSCGSYYGQGILRSADGGDTWTLLGQSDFEFFAISQILIDPGSAGSTTSTTLFASVRLSNFNGGTSACGLVPTSSTGGVYRSEDSGATWELLNVPTGASGTQQIHDMGLDPTDGNTLYAAVRGFGDQSVAGIWKSTNALAATPTFTRIATGYADGNGGDPDPQTRRSNFDVCEGTPSTIYSVIESLGGSAVWGMYKSTDSGANWSHVDGGDNGTGNITSGTNALTRVSGPSFTASMVGQNIVLEDRISRTVAAVADGDNLTLSSNVAETLTGGTWSVGRYPLFCNGQCFYNVMIGCDPADDDVVYVGGNPNEFANDLSGLMGRRDAWRSNDGGDTWTGISQGDGTSGGLHTDVHSIAFDDSVSPTRVYLGSDGGVWRSEDQGASWTSMNTNLAITQFQSLGLHPNDVDVVIGGTQDNGTNIRRRDLVDAPGWFHTDFGDGGQSFIDQSDPTRMFHTYFNGATFHGPARSTNSGIDGPGNWAFTGGYFGFGAFYYNGFTPGEGVLFYAPLAQHEAYNPNVVYFGTTRVYRSPDPQPPFGATSWTMVSPSIGPGGERVSWIEAFPTLIGGDEVIYAGGAFGSIMVAPDVDATTSGCPGACTSTWNSIDDPSVTPPRFVTDIEVSRADATGNTVYVTFSGFGTQTPSTPGHVYRTTNGLAATPTWTDLSGNLPDVPTSAIALDHTTTPVTIYVGTDVGVFVSTDNGTTYNLENDGHPLATVFGLDRNPSTGQIVSATHGRGMFEVIGTGALGFSDGFESGDTLSWSGSVP